MTCPHCADAASLRAAFYAATEELFRLRAALPENHPAIAVWAKLYEAVRDHTAGLAKPPSSPPELS